MCECTRMCVIYVSLCVYPFALYYQQSTVTKSLAIWLGKLTACAQIEQYFQNVKFVESAAVNTNNKQHVLRVNIRQA